MDPAAAEKLLVYGPLGLWALASVFVIRQLYKDREKERKAHNAEMRGMEEKFVTKSEEWVEQYHALASAQSEMLRSIIRKIDGKRGESSPSHPYRDARSRRTDRDDEESDSGG